MAKGSYKCSLCSRTFVMPGHLARHMNATHGKGKKKAGAKRVGRPPGRPRANSTTAIASRLGLSDMTMEQLTQVMAAACEEARSRITNLERAFS